MKQNELGNIVILYWVIWITAAYSVPQMHGVGNILILTFFNPIGWSLMTGVGVVNGYLFRKSRLSAHAESRRILSTLGILLFAGYLALVFFLVDRYK